jgi:uncharacterized membrane protein YfcA
VRVDRRDLIAGVLGAAFLLLALPDRLTEAALIWLLCLFAYLYGRSVDASHHDAF